MLLTINIIAVGEAGGQPIDQTLATQAYTVVENWVDRGSVPTRTVAIEAEDVAAAHVTLRFEGVTLGQATAAVDQPMRMVADRKPRDFMPLLLTATRDAIAEAKKTLVTLSAKPGGDTVPNDYRQIAPLLQLDLQLARSPQLLTLAQPSDLTAKMTVGVHGLAMRHEGRWAWTFPGSAIAANLSLPDQLNRMLRDLSLDITQLPTVGDRQAMFRFEVLHLIRRTADGPVARLHRGQDVVPAGPLSERSIQTVAKLWADHLIYRQQSDGGFTGTYQPTSDRFDPPRASITDTMLACYALARYSRSPALGEDQAQRYAAAARRGVQAAIEQLGAMPEPVDDPTEKPRAGEQRTVDKGMPAIRCRHAAMTLLALIETPGTADLKPARDRLAGALLACSGPEGRFRSLPDQRSGEVSRPTHALATLALVKMYGQTRQAIYLDTARQAGEAMWTDAESMRIASVMPWAAMMEFELLGLGQPTQGLLVVRNHAELLWETQVSPAAAAANRDPVKDGYVSPDTVGGLALATDIVPEPTWLTAGPLAGLAAGLPVGGFVAEADRGDWALDAAVGLRFLYQLTMTPDAAWYVHDLPRSVGGVRTAFWDNRQPPAATAMALLAAAELQHALARLDGND